MDESLKDQKELGGLVEKRQKPIKPQKAPSPPTKYDFGDPNYNSKAVQMVVYLKALPRISLLDPEQVSDRIDEYFNICIDQNEKPTTAGLCLALGVSRNEFEGWLRGDTKYNPKQQEAAQRAHLMLEALSEKYLLDGKTYPASIIFYLKNQFGYKDETERTIQVKEKWDNTTAEDIREQYLKEKNTVIDNDTQQEEVIDAEFDAVK